MALTPEDVRALQAPFAMKDHRFLQKKDKQGQVVAELAYVPERPTTDRLDSIDRDWAFNILSKERSAKQVVIHAVLTVKGVSRENIGMQKVDDEYGEAEKGATTDALRRCARMFGIARYTLDAPKNRNEFGVFLAKLQQEYSASAPQAPAATLPANVRPITPAHQRELNSVEENEPPPTPTKTSEPIDPVYEATKHLFDHHNHYLATVRKMAEDGELGPDGIRPFTDDEEIAAIKANRSIRLADKAGLRDFDAIYEDVKTLFVGRASYDAFVKMLADTKQVDATLSDQDVINKIRFMRVQPEPMGAGNGNGRRR